MARPTTYKKKYANELIDLMAEGRSLAAFAAKLRVTRQTLYNWARQHEDFAEAMAIGKDLAQAKWEEIAMNTAIDGKGNAAVINFQMKNRFRNDYVDSSAMTLAGGEDPLEINETHVIKFIMPEGHESASEEE